MISKKQIALVHVAKHKLGLSETEYRDVLGGVGAASSTKLTARTFEQVMDHFRRLGFTPRPAGASSGKPPRASVKYDSKEKLLGKTAALIADLGLTWGYVDAIARQMFGIDCVKWCSAHQLHKIVAALSYKQRKDKGYVYR